MDLSISLGHFTQVEFWCLNGNLDDRNWRKIVIGGKSSIQNSAITTEGVVGKEIFAHVVAVEGYSIFLCGLLILDVKVRDKGDNNLQLLQKWFPTSKGISYFSTLDWLIGNHIRTFCHFMLFMMVVLFHLPTVLLLPPAAGEECSVRYPRFFMARDLQ